VGAGFSAAVRADVEEDEAGTPLALLLSKEDDA